MNHIVIYLLSIVFSVIFITPKLSALPQDHILGEIDQYTTLEETEKEQFNQVDQLQDIQPGDWAADALQNLIDHYQCIPGNIQKFEGNKTINREEFAAILNLCLTELEKLIITSNQIFINKEDLTKLQQLKNQFAPELVKLNQKLEKGENRTEILRANKFSPTGKLTGDIAIGMVGLFGEKKAGNDLQDNGIIIHRTRLNFDSSFTGKDFLRVRLQARNSTSLNTNITGTNMTRLSIDGSDNNAISLNDSFYYKFPVSDRTNIWIIGGSFGAENIVNLMNPPITSDSNHGISAFGLFNPVYRMALGPGIAIKHKFDDQLSFTFNYRARNSNVSTPQFGLFNGNYALVTELAYTPSKNFGIGFAYINNYFRGSNIDLFGGIGSEFARKPFNNVSSSVNSYAIQTHITIMPNFDISGWASLSNVQAESGINKGANADIINWAVIFSFLDVGKKGDFVGLIFGMPPQTIYNDLKSRQDQDTSLLFDMFYRYQVNDNLALTPGFMLVTNPEHNQNNPPIYIGILRGSFRF